MRCSLTFHLDKKAILGYALVFTKKPSYVLTVHGSYDVTDPNDMDAIRRLTGICPQHDVLFDELTAREHLQFFARIRVGHDRRKDTK